MSLETAEAGVVSDGNVLVLFVPTIADTTAPTKTELTAGTVKKITYSATGDGYKHTVTVNKVAVNRFTMKQQIQYDGSEVDDLSITYVYGGTSEVAFAALGTVGTTGFIVERLAVPNGDAVDTGDIVTVIPIKTSLAVPDAPVTNQELTRTQVLNVTDTVQRDVVVVAGT